MFKKSSITTTEKIREKALHSVSSFPSGLVSVPLSSCAAILRPIHTEAFMVASVLKLIYRQIFEIVFLIEAAKNDFW